MRRRALGALGLLVLVLGGCQPFKAENTIKMESSSYHRIDIDAPGSKQHVKVTTDSEGVPLDVYIVLETNAEAVENALRIHKDPDKELVLASQARTAAADLEADIPAKKAYVVFLAMPHKSTSVTYKIVGR